MKNQTLRIPCKCSSNILLCGKHYCEGDLLPELVVAANLVLQLHPGGAATKVLYIDICTQVEFQGFKFLYNITLPNSSLKSCLDPGSPGTSLELRVEEGKGRLRRGLTRLVGKREAAGIQQRWREHDRELCQPILDVTQLSQRPTE